MISKIYCRTTEKGVQSYYLTDGKKNYNLFDTAYRKSNKEFFLNGRSIDEVLNARRHVSASVRRISVRLIGLVKYVESEYGICVLRRTARRQQGKVRSDKMYRRSERLAYAV